MMPMTPIDYAPRNLEDIKQIVVCQASVALEEATDEILRWQLNEIIRAANWIPLLGTDNPGNLESEPQDAPRNVGDIWTKDGYTWRVSAVAADGTAVSRLYGINDGIDYSKTCANPHCDKPVAVGESFCGQHLYLYQRFFHE